MTSIDPADRRKYRRIPTALSATYRSTSLTADGCIRNISQGGVFITTKDRDDPVGTVAELSLRLPGAGALSLRGTVSWVSPADHGMGIAFGPLNRASRRALANFLLARSQRP